MYVIFSYLPAAPLTDCTRGVVHIGSESTGAPQVTSEEVRRGQRRSAEVSDCQLVLEPQDTFRFSDREVQTQISSSSQIYFTKVKKTNGLLSFIISRP